MTVKAFLHQAKILDTDGTLSLTSIAMMVLIVKLAVEPSLDWTTMTAFFLALVNYNLKKGFHRDRVKKDLSDVSRLEKLEAEQKLLVQASNIKGLR